MAKILLSLPDTLLKKVDDYCGKYDFERSEFIRSLIRNKIEPEPTLVEKSTMPVENKTTIHGIAEIPGTHIPQEVTIVFDELWEDSNFMPVKKVRLEAGYCSTFHTAGEKRPLYDISKFRADGSFEYRQKLCKECVKRELSLLDVTGGHLE